ncbi:MAG: lipoyl(octanoyl) transferase LipB [Thermocladium sp.]
MGYLLDLGFMQYGRAWAIMRAIHEARVNDVVPDTLIVVIHDHVYTTGRKGNASNLLKPILPLYWVERGGDITYHGPGQLVYYPIIKLRMPVGSFVTLLEEAVINALSNYGIEAKHNPSHRGVWVGDRKICSIGVAVMGGVSLHGLALNVNTDLRYFTYINPCGLDSSKITSMQMELGREVDVEDVKGKLTLSIASLLDMKLKAVTLNDLINSGLNPEKYGEPARLSVDRYERTSS